MDLTKSKLKPIVQVQMSNHSSHHILSSCKVHDLYFVTGHTDSTFKIWGFNPDFFVTSHSKGSGKQLRVYDLKDPRKENKPFNLIYTSPSETFHKNFVTALSFYERHSDLKNILVSGDGIGNLIASEIRYDKSNGRLQKVVPFFTMEHAHRDVITKIERYKDTDIVLTTSQDCCMSFWNLAEGQQIANIERHQSPIQSFQFMNNYETLITCSIQELFTWKVSYSYNEESRYGIEDNESSSQIDCIMEREESLANQGIQYPVVTMFGSNYPNDYLLFVTSGSDIKLLNILTGEYVGEIEGAHFKGTTNFGLITDNSPQSKLRDILSEIQQKVESGDAFHKTSNKGA